ncbi:S41 family peptidase [Sphingobacterium spiritivorum]|uniref:S41 family peptidase n=1 Tax=Sphingobacterium spiritivorum TaxID=258 RepID=UPI001918D6FC|nr:S41 family peptidase [Sphingobacterium spiritivorum]QQT25812.1 carboxyl-terminal protease [Sphingobacterium spiritivorum]
MQKIYTSRQPYHKIWSRHLLFFLLPVFLLASCKKDKDTDPEEDKIISPTTGTRTQFTLDSIFLYARQVYLWQDALPTYQDFDPRTRYGSINPELTAFKKELFDITQYKKNSSGIPFENPIGVGVSKYSNIEKGTAQSGSTAAIAATSSPILYQKTWQEGNQSIGYIALGSFPILSSCQAALDDSFATMAAFAPTNLIIDLRSNGGGYVETAKYLTDLIAPTSLNGKVMFTEQFNPIMREGKATILTRQVFLNEQGKTVSYQGRVATMADVNFSEQGTTKVFEKKGKLESVKNIYFIVTGRTASASELVISSLMPYFPVKLIGQKTYGKPVGFFAINIDQYKLYLASFLIRNANGWSDYFNGIPVDVNVTGVPSLPLGDPNEPYLAATLDLISGKVKSSTSARSATTQLTQTEQQEAVPYVPMIKRDLKLK